LYVLYVSRMYAYSSCAHEDWPAPKELHFVMGAEARFCDSDIYVDLPEGLKDFAPSAPREVEVGRLPWAVKAKLTGPAEGRGRGRGRGKGRGKGRKGLAAADEAVPKAKGRGRGRGKGKGRGRGRAAANRVLPGADVEEKVEEEEAEAEAVHDDECLAPDGETRPAERLRKRLRGKSRPAEPDPDPVGVEGPEELDPDPVEIVALDEEEPPSPGFGEVEELDPDPEEWPSPGDAMEDDPVLPSPGDAMEDDPVGPVEGGPAPADSVPPAEGMGRRPLVMPSEPSAKRHNAKLPQDDRKALGWGCSKCRYLRNGCATCNANRGS
jgi:hypothetical protein